ncbi:MAG: AEC family transporter, partial [Dictyoglomus turgidum]
NKSIMGVSVGVLLKLILFPLFALITAKLLNLSDIPLKVTVLESAMPSMLTALVLSLQFNLDYVFTSQVITYSTLLSLITLNLWIGVIK